MRERTVAALALGLVTVLGGLHLPDPLSGDAALYQTGARALAAGRVLYRDVWDLKQPGIYAFHWLAGRALGFGEVGLHGFELALMLGLSVALAWALRRAYEPRWLSSVVPITTVATYYAVASEWHLTQPAALLSIPLFGVVACVGGRPRSATRWALAGACGAVAVVLKVYAIVVVAPILAAALWIAHRVDGDGPHALLRRRVLPFAVGAGLVWGALLLWLWATGALPAFLWTHGEWRRLALAVRGPYPRSHAVHSARWFAGTFWPWLLLAFCAPLRWRGLAAERDFLLAGVWLGAGALATFLEPFAAWPFDFLVLVVPAGVLAVRGLQGLLADGRAPQWLRRPGAALALLTAVLLLTSGGNLFTRAASFPRHAPLVAAGDRAYQRAVSGDYEAIWRSTAFLRSGEGAPGAIYVFGDPLILLLSGRRRAASVHGWAWDLQPALMWATVERELRLRRPPYIFVSTHNEGLISARASGLRRMLRGSYTVRASELGGTWYELRSS